MQISDIFFNFGKIDGGFSTRRFVINQLGKFIILLFVLANKFGSREFFFDLFDSKAELGNVVL